MSYSLGNEESIRRINLGCQLAHALSDQAREKADDGDMGSAIELLTAAHAVEPRYLEKRELLRRIHRMAQVNVDWPESSPKVATR